MSAQTEILERFFAAINRNDMDAASSDFDPEIVRIEPDRFFEQGDRVVVYLHARVRLTGAKEWIGGRFADGFVIRAGRIVEYLSFAERKQALEWAGIAPPA